MAEIVYHGKRKLEEESTVIAGSEPAEEYDSDEYDHDLYVGKSRMDRETRKEYRRQVKESENTRYKFVENVTVTTSVAAGYWCRNTFLAKDSDAPYTVKTFQARGFWGICGERIIAFCRLKKTSSDQGDEYPPYINADYKVRQ